MLLTGAILALAGLLLFASLRRPKDLFGYPAPPQTALWRPFAWLGGWTLFVAGVVLIIVRAVQGL